jgi:DNA mismatch endonuclease, patch repair protein
MVDRLSTQQRSRLMASIGPKDTRPEKFVRSTLHALGYRFRLHEKTLLGKPDIVFPGRKKIIFVNGCFWHGHDCRGKNHRPMSNTKFWVNKIKQNQARDKKVTAHLRRRGWSVATIWECELRRGDQWLARTRRFLDR